eukprot:15348281-Ditylum_brightwellii.AAC.1
MGWLDEACILYTIVFTKNDCVSLPIVVRHTNEVCMRFHSLLYAVEHNVDDDDKGEAGRIASEVYMNPVVHNVSSKNGKGILEIKWSLDSHFAPVNQKQRRGEDDYLYGHDVEGDMAETGDDDEEEEEEDAYDDYHFEFDDDMEDIDLSQHHEETEEEIYVDDDKEWGDGNEDGDDDHRFKFELNNVEGHHEEKEEEYVFHDGRWVIKGDETKE